GEVTGYLGRNGSGKSTTIKMITGLIERTAGQILYCGQPIDDDLISYKRRMGYVPEEPNLYNHLSGLEYLVMVSQLRGLPARESSESIDGLLRLLALYDDRHVSISGYSKGMRQKVLIAAALLHNPELVLLDEPFSGLDVASSLVLRSLIQQLATRGKTVLFSSHELDTVERISNRVVILHHGKIEADIPRFLGQVAGVLIFIGGALTFGLLVGSSGGSDLPALQAMGMNLVRMMVSGTMLIAGLTAVTTWDNIFPDKRDAMVLGPL